jgi:hypothetical protein
MFQSLNREATRCYPSRCDRAKKASGESVSREARFQEQVYHISRASFWLVSHSIGSRGRARGAAHRLHSPASRGRPFCLMSIRGQRCLLSGSPSIGPLQPLLSLPVLPPPTKYFLEYHQRGDEPDENDPHAESQKELHGFSPHLHSQEHDT